MKWPLPAWFDLGACHGQFPTTANPFFPQVRGGRFDAKTIQRALDLCIECPVKAECLAYAKTIPGVIGVWGGRMHTGPTNRARYDGDGRRKPPGHRKNHQGI